MMNSSYLYSIIHPLLYPLLSFQFYWNCT